MPDLRNRNTFFLFFLVAFVLKFMTAMFIRYLLSCTPVGYHLDDLVIRGDDYYSYNGAMENYIQTGKYYFFNGRHNVFAGRLPHYSMLYLFFRQFLNIPLANFGVMVLQITLECVALVFLARLAALIIRSQWAFYATYILSLLSLAVSFYSIIVLPDSLSVSLLILFSYAFYIYLKKPTAKLLLLSGLLLGLVTTLKPHLGVLFIIVGYFFLKEIRCQLTLRNMTLVAWKTILVSLPLLFLLLPWVIRNYKIYNQFIPFTVTIIAGYNYTEADLACRRYLQSFGEDFLFWDEKSAGYYFKTCRDSCCFLLPDYIYTSKYGRSEIEAVRTQYQNLQNNFSDVQDRKVAASFDALTQIYSQEKPFRYHVIARLTSIGNFLSDNSASYEAIRTNAVCFRPYHLLVKYLQILLYWSSLILGFTGLLWLVKTDRDALLFLSVPVYLLLFFPIILRWTEGRYFIHSYPFLFLGLVFIMVRGWDKFKWAARKND